MTRSEVVTWLKNSFTPVTLATPDPHVMQIVEDAIRYWNSHSAYKAVKMYDYTNGTVRVQVDPEIKQVAQVYPAQTTSWIMNDHPMWSLLGTTILDTVTSDLIQMSEAFRNYRVYLGTDFRWMFQKSDDPAVGGWLYVISMPVKADRICVEGTKRILPSEDIKLEHILYWIQRYALAMLKQAEGSTLRKSDLIGAHNDGDRLVDEGKEEKDKLEETLAQESMWICFSQRF